MKPFITNLSFTSQEAQVNKISLILEKLRYEFTQNLDLKTSSFKTPLKTLNLFKQSQKITSICLIELCHILQQQGFDSLISSFFQLFNLMKWQTIAWISFHNKFAEIRKTLEFDLYEEIKKLKISIFEELKAQKREFTSENWSFSHIFRREDIDKFEKLEKARFFLYEEEIELRKLAEISEKTEKELKTSMNRVKDSLNRIPISKTKKFLMQTLREMKRDIKEEDSFGELPAERSPSWDFSMMKEDLLSKMDTSSRKAILNYLGQMAFHNNNGIKENNSNIKEPVLMIDKFVETEDLEASEGFNMEEMTDKKAEGYILEIKRMEEKQKTMKKQLDAKKVELEEIETEANQRKEKVNKLVDEVSKLENKLEDLEAKEINRTAREKKNTNNRNKEKFDVENFKSKEKEYKTIIEEFENKNNGLTADNSQLKEKNKEFQEKNKGLQEKIEEFQKNLEYYTSNEYFESHALSSKDEFIEISHENNDKKEENQQINKKIVTENIKPLEKANTSRKIIEKPIENSVVKPEETKVSEKETDKNDRNITMNELKIVENTIIINEKTDNLEQIKEIKENHTKSNKKSIKSKKNVASSTGLKRKKIITSIKTTEKAEISQVIEKNDEKTLENEKLKLENQKLIEENKKMLENSMNLMHFLEENNKLKAEIKGVTEENKKAYENSRQINEKLKELNEINRKNTLFIMKIKEKPIETLISSFGFEKIKELELFSRFFQLPKAKILDFLNKSLNNTVSNEKPSNTSISTQTEVVLEKKPEILLKKTEKKAIFSEKEEDFNKFKKNYYLKKEVKKPKKDSFPSLISTFSNENKTTESLIINTDRETRKSLIPEAMKTSENESFFKKNEPDFEINEDLMEVPEEIRKEIEENFAKTKFLFKYPFKGVNDWGVQEGKIKKQREFQVVLEKLMNLHKKCGPNCEHLRKFFKKIGFGVNYKPKSMVMIMNKTVFDKLPEI